MLSGIAAWQNPLLENIQIKGTTINVDDQLEMLHLTKEMNDTSKTEANLKFLDQLPKSVYHLVEPSIDIGKVLEISLFMAILYLASAIFNYIQGFSMTTISNNFAKKL